MRRLIIFVVVATGILLIIRNMAKRGAPVMQERCSEMCNRMLANMPDSFPPNRIMADLKSIKEQTVRILKVVEEQTAD